jgi:hypothetical protein
MTIPNFRHVGRYTGAICCPFFDEGHCICRAALLTMTPDTSHRNRYCCGDDHDDCALFLAKALRSSAPGGLDRDLAAHCGK